MEYEGNIFLNISFENLFGEEGFHKPRFLIE